MQLAAWWTWGRKSMEKGRLGVRAVFLGKPKRGSLHSLAKTHSVFILFFCV